ncbi:MAG: desulfoferrodoxin family protein [Deltaproteobacteria bacterium]|nr:desulfoferrodoxin family protein [Deltaproteobacteria bacterium]
MKGLKKHLSFVILLFILFILTTPSFANKASVTLQVPASVQKGSEVIIRVNVSHEGISFLHYTQWVAVKVNGKIIARWDYSSTDRPGSEKFFKEVKVTATEPLEIVAEASCNIHGSAGPATAKIEIP